MCPRKRNVGRIDAEHYPMSTALVSPAIDRVALERVANDPIQDAVADSRERILDAQAELRASLDEQIMANLQQSARVLLAVRWPAFDFGRTYSLEQLTQIQTGCETLQDRIQALIEISAKNVQESQNPRLKELLRVLTDASNQAFAYTEEVRWAAMNAEAEAEIASGNGKSFANMDAALAYLSKLRK